MNNLKNYASPFAVIILTPGLMILLLLLCLSNRFLINSVIAYFLLISQSKACLIDTQRLQCYYNYQTYQIKEIKYYLPLGLAISHYGLKTQSLSHVFLPAFWNRFDVLIDLYQRASRP
jgi:hypothetical protein